MPFWDRLRFKPLNWTESLKGLGLLMLGSGIIFGILKLIYSLNDWELDLDPVFLKSQSFAPSQWYIVLLWMFFFFFNIVGEEILWRGYILYGMEEDFKYSYLINSALWTVFHIAFGFKMVIMLIPTMLVVPYYVQKTENTLTGIFLHGVFNGGASVFLLIKGFASYK